MNLRSAVFLLLGPLLSSACGTGAESNQDPASRPSSQPSSGSTSVKPLAADALHAPFDAMLRRHVSDGLVDYEAWKNGSDRADRVGLATYRDALAAVDVTKLEKDAQLAFYINLYNATMVSAVLDRLSPTYSTSENEFGVFDEKLVQLHDRKVSLNELEHDIVRKTFDEPRIHVALVCGARSCPPLLSRAYRADDLDAVLEANMRAFVAGGVRNKIAGPKLELSKLFEWYADDFGGADKVPAYVARYAPEGVKVDGKAVSFLEYSWKLNRAEDR